MGSNYKKLIFTISLFVSNCYTYAADLISEPKAKPRLTISDPLSSFDVFQIFYSFILVIVVIVVLLWLLKKVGRFSTSMNKQIRIVGGVTFGAREKVVLVQVGEKQLLVGVSSGSVNLLLVLDKNLEVDGPSESTVSIFAEKFKSMLSFKEKK